MENQLETWINATDGRPVRVAPPPSPLDWKEWHGADKAPVNGETRVDVRFRGGERSSGETADYWTWSHTCGRHDIVAYRLHAANDNHPQEDAFMADGLRGTTVRYGRPKGPIGKDTAPPADVKAAIADEAKRIVTGARRSAYGAPEDNFARIAAYWNAYAQCKGWSVVFTAADVSPMMRGMKEARLVETPDHRDSFVDLCGYTLTGAEVNGVAA